MSDDVRQARIEAARHDAATNALRADNPRLTPLQARHCARLALHAADAVAAPAVGVTVEQLDGLQETATQHQARYAYTRQSGITGRDLYERMNGYLEAMNDVRALLTAQPDQGTGEEQS